MSPVTRTTRDGRVRPARYRTVQPGVVAWLTLVWLLLWGNVTPLLVLGGVVIAIVVCLVFPLPPLRMNLRVRPLPLLSLVLRFGLDVVVASWQVTRVTFRRATTRNAVIAVQLRTPSDFVLTVVGEMLSLVPGSVLVEANRSTHTLYLHVLDVADRTAVEAYRTLALAQEARVVRAFGVQLDHLELPVDEARHEARARAKEEER